MSDAKEVPAVEDEVPADQPIEIEDEYNLALEEADVEDEGAKGTTRRHQVRDNELWGRLYSRYTGPPA
jgi:hypothetical protein